MVDESSVLLLSLLRFQHFFLMNVNWRLAPTSPTLPRVFRLAVVISLASLTLVAGAAFGSSAPRHAAGEIVGFAEASPRCRNTSAPRTRFHRGCQWDGS